MDTYQLNLELDEMKTKFSCSQLHASIQTQLTNHKPLHVSGCFTTLRTGRGLIKFHLTSKCAGNRTAGEEREKGEV